MFWQHKERETYLFLNVKSRNEIEKHKSAVNDDSSPSMATVNICFNKFHSSIFDEPGQVKSRYFKQGNRGG